MGGRPTPPISSAWFTALLALATGAGFSLNHAVWFSARAAGLVAYVLATSSVLFGLATATRAGDRVAGRGTVADAHRALSLLTIVAIGTHVLLLAFDQWAKFGLAELLVPFVSWYRPFWTGLGVLAAYLAIAVYVSFYLRSRIGYRTWRALHYASFAIFVAATFHGLFAGSDGGAVWARGLYAAAASGVALAIAYRLLRGVDLQPVWAWGPRAGDMGAVRVMLAVGALTLGVLLPMATLALPRSGVGAPAQVAASGTTTTDSTPARSNGDDEEDGASGGRDDTVLIAFSGSARHTGSWHLLATNGRAVALDVTPDGTMLLGNTLTGEVLYRSRDAGQTFAGSGRLQAVMDGQGRAAGGTIQMDATYSQQGGWIRVVAQLTNLGGG